MQVTLSKFHALNFKIGSILPFWTLLKKVHVWRSKQAGAWSGGPDADNEDHDVEQATPANETAETSVPGLLKQLKRLQRSQHTLDLARSIFEDVRVRQLGFMLLD